MQFPKELPNNLACEQALLACLLNDEWLIPSLKIKEEMFFSKELREFFALCLESYWVSQTIDISYIASKWWEGMHLTYLDIMWMWHITQSGFNEYQDCIIENHNKRLIIKWLQKAIAMASSDVSVDNVLQQISDTAQWIENVSTEEDFLSVIQTTVDELWTNTSFICNYWLPRIDDILWWYRIGQLIVIWARPWVGKTSVLLSFAHEIVKQQKKCLILSLEMTAKEIASRLISKISNVTMWSLARIQWERINQVARQVAEQLDVLSNFSVRDDVFDIAWIMSSIRKTKHKSWLDVVFIDYLWLIGWGKWDNRNLEIQNITRWLKQLAKELEISIVILSQLNRNMEQSNRSPQLSDLRESGAIEQDADVVILLHRNFQDSPNEMQVAIAKHRNWRVDVLDMWFHAQTMTLMNDLISSQ